MTSPPDYKALSEALVLYTYRLRALGIGTGSSISTATQADYNDAYHQLLRTQNLEDGGSVPADPSAEFNAPYVSEEHTLALRTAIRLLKEALRVMESDLKIQEERSNPAETLIDFITSQELSSRALHQVMERFSEYSDLAERELMEANEEIATFYVDSDHREVICQAVVPRLDRVMHDEIW
jgi:hypothetical protein